MAHSALQALDVASAARPEWLFSTGVTLGTHWALLVPLGTSLGDPWHPLGATLVSLGLSCSQAPRCFCADFGGHTLMARAENVAKMPRGWPLPSECNLPSACSLHDLPSDFCTGVRRLCAAGVAAAAGRLGAAADAAGGARAGHDGADIEGAAGARTAIPALERLHPAAGCWG